MRTLTETFTVADLAHLLFNAVAAKQLPGYSGPSKGSLDVKWAPGDGIQEIRVKVEIPVSGDAENTQG